MVMSEPPFVRPSRFARRPAIVIAVLWLLFLCVEAPAAPWKVQTPTGLTLEIIPPGSRGDPAFHLERRTPDGLTDGRFGPRGRIRFTMGQDYEPPAGLRVDGAGRVLVIGSSQPTGGVIRPVVLRFLPNGQPDSSWGVNGRSEEAPAGWGSRALDALPLADGRVLVVGTVEVTGDERAALWRLTPEGRLDESAGLGNRVALASSDASRVVSLSTVQEGEVMLAVRVLTDAGMLLEGHALKPAEVDATPSLVSRQPWPPAWVDAPDWRSRRWVDPVRPNDSVAAVLAGPRSHTVPWEPLVRNVPESPLPTASVPTATPAPTEANATGAGPGGAAFNPYATQDGRRADARASDTTTESQSGAFIAFMLAAAALVAGAVAYIVLARRKQLALQGGRPTD